MLSDLLSDEDLRDLVRILDSTHLDELHVETADLSVTVHRAAGGWGVERRVTREPVEVARETGPGSGDGGAAAAATTPEDDVGEGHRVLPPLMGTFYRAPKPGAEPFVEEGSPVEPETVVAIVETMKMMNPVHAGAHGRVTRILVGDAEPVDADTTLMVVEPDSGEGLGEHM